MEENHFVRRIYQIYALCYYLTTALYFSVKRLHGRRNIFIYAIQLLQGNADFSVILDHKFFFKIRDVYDILAIHEMFYDHVYEPLFKNIPINSTYIDVGSYIGDSIVYASQFPNIKNIISVEPVPDHVRIIKEVSKKNHISNIVIIEKALSTKNGYSNFYLQKNRGRSTLNSNNESSRKIKVPLITLKEILNLVETNQVILKCDCEGEEDEIFIKTSRKILTRFERIIIEYHSSQTIHKIMNRLKDIGFHLKKYNNPINDNLGLLCVYK